MTLPLSQGAWTWDPAHSSVEFSVRHLGITTVRGRFADASAQLHVGDSLATSSLSAEVQMASVDTGNADRDAHLTGGVFGVEANPTMTFTSTEITETGSGSFAVVGNLTLNGVTRQETFAAELSGTETFPMDGSIRAGFTAVADVDRTAYGIDFNVPLTSGGFMLSDLIAVTVQAQLVGPV